LTDAQPYIVKLQHDLMSSRHPESLREAARKLLPSSYATVSEPSSDDAYQAAGRN